MAFPKPSTLLYKILRSCNIAAENSNILGFMPCLPSMTIWPVFGSWPSLPLFLAAAFQFRSHSNSGAYLQTAPSLLTLELLTRLLPPQQPPTACWRYENYLRS